MSWPTRLRIFAVCYIVYKYVCCVHPADCSVSCWCVVFTLYVYVKLNGLEKSKPTKKQYQPYTDRALLLYRSFLLSFHLPIRCLFCLLLTTCSICCFVFFICLRLCSMFIDFVFQYVNLFLFVGALSLFACCVCLKKATTNMDLFAQPSPQPPPPPSPPLRPPTPLTDTRPIYAAMMSMWKHHLHTACIKVLFVFLFAIVIYYQMQMPTMKI